MKGIIIASHGDMAQGILGTSKLFFGEQPQITALCLQAEDNPEAFDERIRQALEEVDTGDGAIIFCDMLFGSPCNSAMRVLMTMGLDNPSIEVVTGVNLAMILQILAVRESSEVSIDDLMNAGHDGIKNLKEVIKANM